MHLLESNRTSLNLSYHLRESVPLISVWFSSVSFTQHTLDRKWEPENMLRSLKYKNIVRYQEAFHNCYVIEGLPRNFRFSLNMWSKLKIVTIQWIKSRIWDTIDNWYINNHPKNQVFFIRALFAEVCHPIKFRELCMETPCLCSSERHKYSSRKVTKTSVTEFYYWSEKLWP